jgi:hypothetical protein
LKIEYDASLYREIANFRLNEVVQVSNRKGIRSTIHITNITRLSWHELQLLVSSGSDRFTKMVLLYREYSSNKEISNSLINGEHLTPDEVREINKYIKIYHNYSCSEHHEVNEIISQLKIWDDFKTIRSLNDHGEYKEIEGIQPKYFEIVCNILKISGGRGLPLDGYKKY